MVFSCDCSSSLSTFWPFLVLVCILDVRTLVFVCCIRYFVLVYGRETGCLVCFGLGLIFDFLNVLEVFVYVTSVCIGLILF